MQRRGSRAENLPTSPQTLASPSLVKISHHADIFERRRDSLSVLSESGKSDVGLISMVAGLVSKAWKYTLANWNGDFENKD
jgi:hypothetical protein